MSENQPLTLFSWPNAILHVDGDSFFASVEQALNPAYKGLPLVTGHERGIASAMSIEAKRLGITRGMPIGQIKHEHPECIVVAGNYEAYMAFAGRMFRILRRYTPTVEEYSIDEAFADITGLRRVLNKSYPEIAMAIQHDIESELDITVSVGVSLTKTLAKLCSKFRKPHGITCVKGRYIHILLARTVIDKVWGIGPNTAAFLRKHGCNTAYDFVSKPASFVTDYLTKREMDIYRELRGECISLVDPTPKASYNSISKAHSFALTADRALLFGQLAKNIEEAAAKCRKYNLMARRIMIILKDHDHHIVGAKAKLSRPSHFPAELLPIAETLFDRCLVAGKNYRQTLCLLSELHPAKDIQLTLFSQTVSIDLLDDLYESVDELNQRFGKGTIHLTESLSARHRSMPIFKVPMLKIAV